MDEDQFEIRIQGMVERIERQNAERELEAIKRDGCAAHALTKLPGTKHGWSYKICTVDDGTSFAYANWKNAAGYYLSWREDCDHESGEGERTEWKAWRTRKAAKKWSAQKADEERKRRGIEPRWEWIYKEEMK